MIDQNKIKLEKIPVPGNRGSVKYSDHRIIYDGEVDGILDEMSSVGYEVEDIWQPCFISNKYDQYAIWAVEVSGRRKRKIELAIAIPSDFYSQEE